MKKVVSFVLSFLFFIQVIPWQAIAEDDTPPGIPPFADGQDNGITSQQLSAALALAGLEEGAPSWHEGMSEENCTTAYQLAQVLKEFIYDRMDGVLDTFQDYDMLSSEGKLDLSGSSFTDTYQNALNLRDNVYYYLDVFEENSRQISYLNLMMNDPDTEEEDRISYGYSILEYYEELKEVFSIVRNDLEIWVGTCDEYDRMLCGETDEFKFYADQYAMVMHAGNSRNTGSPVLLTMEKETAPSRGNRIIDRLSPITSALADTRQKMELTVVDDRSFVVRAKENGTNVSGVRVTLQDVDKNGKSRRKKEISLTTNARGAAVGLVRDYSPDTDGIVTLDIGMKKDGYRTLQLRKVEIKKGATYNVRLEKDDGTPYVIEASYNGCDMMNNRYDLIVSDMAQVTDEVTLTTYGKSGYTFDFYYTKDGKKNMLASNIQGKSGEETHTSVKKQYAKIIPGDARLFIDLKYEGKSKTIPLQLKPIKAVVDEPMKLPGVSSVFNKNITINLPKSWPGPLSAMKVNIDIPLVDKWPFNAMLLPNGMAFVMVGFHAGKTGMDLKNKWANIMGKMVKQVESEGWRRVQEIKSGGASDFKLPVWKLATLKLDWCIMGYATGQFTGINGRDDLRVLRLAGNVGLNVKMQGDVQFIFGGIATVGITGTLNAIVSMGLGINIFYAQSGRSWKYQRWEYSPGNTGFTITVRLELGVFAGLGFKGIASVTVTGYGFLELVCRFGGTRSYELVGGFGARLTAQFFFIKAVKQLGEEIKYQLLPTFKRLSFRPEQLNRFIQMFQPAAALAEDAKKNTNVVTTSSINDKLVLPNNVDSELRNIQDDSISVVRIHIGRRFVELTNDYVFYLARDNQTDKVGLNFHGARATSKSISVLEIIEKYYQNNPNRFLEKDSLTFATVRNWDVVGYHVETMPLPSEKGLYWGEDWNLYIITMLMADKYEDVPVDEETTVKVPRNTAAVVATFLGSTGGGIEMREFSPKSNTKFASAVSIFMAADENDAPICHPVTETELIGSNGTGTGTEKPSYWIRLTCSPTSSVAAEKVKSYSIRLDLGHPTDTAKDPSQEKITGSVASRTLGLGNADIGSYTFEHIRPGAQRYTGHPYIKDDANSEIAVQDHWYALATPKGEGDDHYLVVNFNAMSQAPKEGSDLFQLDKEPVLDFCVYNREPSVSSKQLGHDFVIYLTKGTDNRMNRLRSASVTLQKSYKTPDSPNLQRMYWADMMDFDVSASTTEIHVSTIYGAPLVWWIEAVSADEKNGNRATWAVRGCWLNDNPAERCLSKPMTFAVIREKKASAETRGPVFFDLIEEEKGAVVGYYALKSEDSSGNISMTLYHFTFRLTPGIDLLSSTFTKEIANAGSYDDIQLAMYNNGNVPISGVDLGIYYKDQKLQDVHVDMENTDRSYCTIYENGKSKRTIKNSTGKQPAVRMISSGLSKKLEDRWSIREWRLHKDKNRIDARSQKRTPLSMPDSYDTVVMSMLIPHQWLGDYSIEIRVEKMYARDKLSFFTTGPKNPSRAALSPVNRLFAISPAIADEAPNDLGNLLAFSPGTGDAAIITPPSGVDIAETDAYRFSTDLDFDSLMIDTAAKDIDLDADVWFDGDEEMVTIYLNESALLPTTEGNEVVSIEAFLDDDETPSYVWEYDSRSSDYDGQLMRDGTGWSLTYPLAVLTGGRDASDLTIQVDSGNDNEALFSNNYVILPLASEPMIIVTEPEDRVENAGNNTTFSVEVSGGHSPYFYQWQVLMPGGTWKDIPDAWSSRLTLYGVYANLDSAQYRCIIEDASGRILTSRAATLTVLSSDVSLPPTGDSQNLTIWLILLGLAGLTVFFLMRKKKR